jgi:hypothetical protein
MVQGFGESEDLEQRELDVAKVALEMAHDGTPCGLPNSNNHDITRE